MEKTKIPNQSNSFSKTRDATDKRARMAGILLLVTAGLTVVMVYARVSADADQATLLQSLQAITANRGMFVVSGIARLLSGLTFVGAGLMLLRTWIIRERWATPWVPYLFMLSGALTTVSGMYAVLVGVNPTLGEITAATSSTAPSYTTLTSLYDMREMTGKIGFSAAGVALLVAAYYQWRVGGTLRKIAPGSALLSVAMQSIWLDTVLVIHAVVGVVFFLWLLVIGSMLATGSTERHFAVIRDTTA